MTLTEDMKRPFVELAAILDALQRRDCSGAISWAQAHESELHSNILFILHKLQYVSLLHSDDSEGAFAYARRVFSSFVQAESREVQRLMAALLYVGRLSESPYPDLANLDSLNQAVVSAFSKEYCRILHMSAISPLMAWCVALSTHFLSLFNVALLLSPF